MPPESGTNPDHAIWLEVERLCSLAIDLAESVQLSIREYPGLNLAGGYLSWLILHELTTRGEVSLGELVELRPTSREWVRRLVGELVVSGFAEFLPNPNRRKSKLVKITPRGRSRYHLISGELDGFAHELQLGVGQIAAAAEVIGRINVALLAVMEKRRSRPPV